MSESIPSSVTGFAHRRPRSDSVASFKYFQEEDESPDWSEDQAVVDDDESAISFVKPGESSYDYDAEPALDSDEHRRSSTYSRNGAEDSLLLRRESAKSDFSGFERDSRTSQKLYIVSEDLTIVIAGFSTRNLGFAIYVACCILTLGLAYLVFRWLPSWRVRLVGTSRPLRDCDWVVIEVRSPLRRRNSRTVTKRNQNQWGEMSVQNLGREAYGQGLSTVFGHKTLKRRSSEYDEDDDPILYELCTLDYRYIRLCYHPVRDKFLLGSDWTDPSWTSVKSMRVGLDSEERHQREQVFGRNEINIEEKSVFQLLVDEVSLAFLSLDHVSDLTRRFTHSISSKLLV